MMDELLLRQLVRQMKIMNFWISMFGSLIVAALAITGFFIYKVVTFVNDTNKKIDNITTQTKETLDFKSQVCKNDTIGGFLHNNTDSCKQ